MSDSWTVHQLGDISLKVGSGATPRGGNGVYLDRGDTSLIRSQNVHNFSFDREGLVFVTDGHARQLQNVEVLSGDVLLNITGDSVARCWQVPDDVLPARVNQHVEIIRPNAETLDSRYLRYFLVSPAMQSRMLSLAAAGATRNALTKGMIESFHIPLPPLPEQRAIAHILGTLDDKIELNRKMNATLDELARTLFTSWFVDFDPVRAKAEGRQPEGMDAETAALFPDRFVDSELGPVPEGWVIRALTDLAEINGWTLGQNEALDPIKYIEISEVKKGEIGNVACYERGTEPSRARRRLRHGDTVLSTVRPDRGAYFLCLNPDPNLIASTGFAVLSPRKAPWAFVYLLSTQASVFKHLGLVADGGAYPAVRPNVIGALQAVIPPTSMVVDKFAQTVAPLLERTNLNRAESTTLASIRDTLLPELSSGQIRVPLAKVMVEVP